MSSLVSRASNEEFLAIVRSSSCLSEVIRKLGYTNPRSKHTYTLVKDRILKSGISIAHFNTHRRPSGVSRASKTKLSDLMVENSTVKNVSSFKRRLVSEGVMKYECALCSNSGEWRGFKLVLQLDHINGINSDNRLDNLRFLCPNCHSQTSTYTGRNKKRN